MQDNVEIKEKTAVKWLEVDENNAGQRIDNFLLVKLKGVPKSKIYRIIRKGEVRVNKGRVKPDYKLRQSDVVRIPPLLLPDETCVPTAGNSLRQVLEAAIIFETPELMVINKPSGLAVHGGSGIQLGLIETLRQMRPEQKFLELVHRLDRGTSGCVMVAKKRSMLRYLHELLRNDGVSKEYLALVIGDWPQSRRVVDAPLVKNQLSSGERFVKVDQAGKLSKTQFQVLKQFGVATLLKAKPITGRTHQIRVHARYVGHSLLGDDKYGASDADLLQKQIGLKRLFLHAAALVFTLPGCPEAIRLETQLPEDLVAVLARLESVT